MDDKSKQVLEIDDPEELQKIIEGLPDGVMLEITYEEGEEKDEI